MLADCFTTQSSHTWNRAVTRVRFIEKFPLELLRLNLDESTVMLQIRQQNVAAGVQSQRLKSASRNISRSDNQIHEHLSYTSTCFLIFWSCVKTAKSQTMTFH